MADGLDKLSGAEEYILAKIELTENLDPDQEESLRVALHKLAPHSPDFYDIGPRRISLSYDPARTSQKKLLQLIKEAGGTPEHIESESSPFLRA